MARGRFQFRLFGSLMLLVVAGAMLFPQCLAGQTAAARTQSDAAADTPTRAEIQALLEKLEDALKTARAAGDAQAEVKKLKTICIAYVALGEKQKALDYCNQALPVLRQLGDRPEEAWTLNYIGTIYDSLWDRRNALEYYTRALAVRREIGDRDGEGMALANIGAAYDNLWEKQKALEYDTQAIAIFHQLGDRASEGSTLINMGVVYNRLGEKQKALECYNQALPIVRQLGDLDGEAIDLTDIANASSDLGEKQKALENYAQALPIFHKLGLRDGEAATLNNIGTAYEDLGDQQKALDYFNQSLPIYREAGDRNGEAMALNNIGNTYYTLGDWQKALGYYNQSLPTAQAAGNLGDVASTMNNIGSSYKELGQLQRALEFYDQALAIARKGSDRGDEAITLNNLGFVYTGLGDKQKALERYSQALSIDTELSNPLEEADVFYKLMLAQKDPQPSLAIFYGKQAVNLLQRVRGNIQGLDKLLQHSFLASKSDYFHGLADLLIAQGRLPEAQQVLDLFKQQEYSDYVRGAAADELSPLTLTAAEMTAAEDYQKSTAQLVSLGEQWEELKKIDPRSKDQEAQFQKLSSQLDAAANGLNDYYNRLYVLLGKNSEANKQLADIKGDVSVLEDQIAESPRTVALYTMVTNDHYRVIVITASATVAREYAISEVELNRKVAEFEQALRNPASDPRQQAQELYNILIGPVKADLDLARAETLVWSLDGVLRYVPLAALYDGKNYIVEKYSTVTITPASFDHLSEKPELNGLSVAAMGISLKYEESLPALPAVATELDGVVNDAKVQGAHGVLPGTILLDGQFTEKAMENELSRRHGVVHIASHFVFQPGDDSKSYLLLAGKDDAGAGYHLTVADFRDNRNLALRNTDLLTLSACETGMSSNASNGREVDGLGMTAQRKGAKAVISSLWSVNDASTGQLMSDFYKRWVDGAGKVAKVEALRQAQLDLLRGKGGPQQAASGRGFGAAAPEQKAPADYTHPYYWAPFVLMGNWR